MPYLDPGNFSITLEVEADLKKLGIDAPVYHGMDEIGRMHIVFKNETDMNLYKVVGKWNNYWWLELEVQK